MTLIAFANAGKPMSERERNSEQCTVYVDGRPITGPVGKPLLEVVNRDGVQLPFICYHPSLGALQTCDVCWVQVDGKLVRGCTLTMEEGLSVWINRPSAEMARREGYDRVIAKHELYCTVCDNNNGDCEVHNRLFDMGITGQKYPFQRKPYQLDDSNPFYTYDPDQCILCGRCVEACQNVEVNETLTIDWTMDHPRVLWDGGKPAGESSCVSCGHCVTVCPCNALQEKTMIGQAGPFTGMDAEIKRPLIELVKEMEHTTGFDGINRMSKMDHHMREAEIRRTKTVCTYCGVGCSFEMWTRDRHILKVQPVPQAPANGISTCIKGKFGWDFVNSPERLTTPLIRDGERFREASWDEAYRLIADRLTSIREKHGNDSVAFVSSSKVSNEENYLIQKMARVIFHTNNVDNCTRYCQNPATKGLQRTVGWGADAGTIRDLEKAELLLIVGSNTADSHPVIASKIKAEKKLRGQKHIVADLRRHEMAERADIFLKPNPSTDLVWLNALARYMFDAGYADMEFISEHVLHLDDFRKTLERYTLEYAEEITGIPVDQLKAAGDMIGQAKSVCAMWAMGVTQHQAGSDTSTAIANLLLTTGNFGRPGTGGYPMRGHNNVQGADDFGAMNNILPGYDKVEEDDARGRWEKGWGVKLPSEPGMDNHTMPIAAAEGRLKAMYIMGEDMALVDSDATHVQEGLCNLDFLVVQDIFFTRTAEFADVVLPGAPNLEKDGTFVNTERRIQRFYKVFEPIGQAKPDWLILTELARQLGHDWRYRHPSQIMDEVQSISHVLNDITYDRLEGWNYLHWPMKADGSDTPLLYTEGFHFPDGKARFHPVDWIEPEEKRDAEFDLHMNNGRLLEQFHETNLTGKSPGIVHEVPETFIEVSPELAADRGLKDGSRVRLTSRRGSLQVRVVVTDRVQGKELYMPEHTRRNHPNLLTGEQADRAVNTPAYKEVAVKMELISADGPTPLPRHNFRYGKRTPAEGVKVRAKWQQPDYVQPPVSAPNPERF